MSGLDDGGACLQILATKKDISNERQEVAAIRFDVDED